MTNYTPIVVSSITLTDNGVYMFNSNLQISTNSSTATNFSWVSVTIGITGNNPLLIDERLNQTASAGYAFSVPLCGIVSNVGTNIYDLKINSNYTGGQPSTGVYAFNYKALRIA
jgi:hypothetical protein